VTPPLSPPVPPLVQALAAAASLQLAAQAEAEAAAGVVHVPEPVGKQMSSTGVVPLMMPSLRHMSSFEVRRLPLAFTRCSFTPKLSRTKQSPLYCPLHLHCSPDCNTITRLMRNIRPQPDPPCVFHTPYKIGSGNIE